MKKIIRIDVTAFEEGLFGHKTLKGSWRAEGDLPDGMSWTDFTRTPRLELIWGPLEKMVKQRLRIDLT